MNKSKLVTDNDQKAIKKRKFTTPVLIKFGDLSTLTQTGGTQEFDGIAGTEAPA